MNGYLNFEKKPEEINMAKFEKKQITPVWFMAY